MSHERVLLDGHNAMHRLGLGDGPQKARRDEIIRRFSRLAPDATIYFDGHRDSGDDPHPNTRVGSVRVVYCNDREADDEILDAVREHATPSRLLVVSDDRRVTGTAKQHGARISGVRDFFGRAPIGGRAAAARRAPRDILHDLEGGERVEPRTRSVGKAFTPADFGLPDEVDLDDA